MTERTRERISMQPFDTGASDRTVIAYGEHRGFRGDERYVVTTVTSTERCSIADSVRLF